MSAPIIVFCHLRWDFVYQRPQQVLSRLAKDRPVILVEEPLRDEASPPHWHRSTHEPNVAVYRPYTPIDAPAAFCDEQMPLLQELMPQLMRDEGLQDEQYVAWFYTPMAMPLARSLKPAAIVYDCMDELSAFMGAPPQMLAREQELLRTADVVFTGGPSLYRAKQSRHHNVHCLSSSVDSAHFGKATDSSIDAEDQKALPHPRIGFFGVIDERLDIQMLGEVARLRPQWQLCMVGPVVKIDPATLPRESNIHYFGQRDYKQLPSYLAGWDVAMLPFARNDATKFISPTKTLEYMAAQKPIVSTPITDVAEPYGDIVYLADDANKFVAACERALNAPPAEARRRADGMRQVLSRTSWDRTAQYMSEQIEKVLEARRNGQTVSTRTEQDAPVLVIGAGPTGLSATYHLGQDALLLEKNDRVGGWCRSVHDRGFTFDMAGHIMFSKDQYVHELYDMLLGDNVHWQDREAWIYSKEVFTRYPFQGCLYGLPHDVITECIVGAIEARFGPLSQNAELEDAVAKAAQKNNGNGHGNGNSHGNGSSNHSDATVKRQGQYWASAAMSMLKDVISSGRDGKANGIDHVARLTSDDRTAHCVTGSGDVKDCCGDGIMEADVELRKPASTAASDGAADKPRNFEEFIYKTWGKGIAKHFAIPYNRKLWAVPLTEMETSWLGGRVPMPNLEEMVRYSLTPAAKPMGPNARFGYPLRGGFQALMEGFLPYVKDQLALNTAVAKISPSRRVVTTSDGREIPYQVLVSTMPLPTLIRMMGDEAPPEVQAAAKGLRFVSVRCVNIGIGRENVTDKHWIYYPEDTVFHRIFVQGNASPHCNPPGGFGITCEITYAPSKPLPCEGDDLVQRCIEDCRQVGLIKEDDEIWAANQVDMPYAYVVYDHDRPRHVKVIREWLDQQDIILSGRYSEWEYYNSDHAFVAGKNAAEAARERLYGKAPARRIDATQSVTV